MLLVVVALTETEYVKIPMLFIALR